MTEPKKWRWRTPPWVEGHIERYLSDDPEAARLWDASSAGVDKMIPSLLLTTRGRRSGEPRHSPLIYGELGGRYVIVASKGGFPDHPLWYLNIEANPEVEIRVGAKQLRAHARTVHGAERAQIWTEMLKLYPPFDEYQARAKDREIPVVVLDPIG
jgi:deazaflavin-dependent oxidoreductase (nitroreductase family)